MSSLGLMMAILCIFCVNLQVHTAPSVSASYYDFPNRHLIIGKNHVQRTTAVYALCLMEDNNQTATCRIILDAGVFNDSEPIYICDVKLSTKNSSEQLEIVGIDLWGKDQAIFTWMNKDNRNHWRSHVTVQTVNMQSCQSKLCELRADNRPDMKPQIFIVASEASYLILFSDKFACDNNFCRITVYKNGLISPPEPWFSTSDSIYNLETIENHYNYLLVSLQDDGWLKYSLLNENEIVEVVSHTNINQLGWSTSNGIISLCDSQHCLQYNHDGKLINTKTFSELLKPIEYAGLYNVPNGKHLALVCDHPRANYRLIQIGIKGELEYVFSLKDLKCNRKPKYFTSKFFNLNDLEYCLSVFQSIDHITGRVKFSTYCLII